MNQIDLQNDFPQTYKEYLIYKFQQLFLGLRLILIVASVNVTMIILLLKLVDYQDPEISNIIPYAIASLFILGFYSGLTIKFHKETPILTLQKFIKRLLDIFLVGNVFIIGMPIFIIIAIAIRLDSPGPVLYRSKRIGQYGKLFYAYKFRTMYIAETNKEFTKVGKFLKRISLNEFPQTINIIEGDLSLVGPWPRLPDDPNILLDDFKKILSVLPGLTGLWQISNFPYQQALRIDLDYVEKWSLWLDFKILLKTVMVVLFR